MKRFDPALPVDQYEKYLTSIHGERNSAGDSKVATCVSCHSNHLIQDVKDPRSEVYPINVPATCSRCHSSATYMAEYKLPTNQFEEYSQSVHGVALLKNSDLNAPACNSCHGNHGAIPPGVASVSVVCGVCHPGNEDLFQKSVHKAAFDEAGIPGCITCHQNHLVKSPTDTMVGLGPGSNCGECHSPSDEAAKTINKMKATLQQLTQGQQEATSLLSRAEQLGMDVAEAKYSLKDINQSLIESRVQIHSFALKPLEESAQSGLKVSAQTKEAANEAIREYHFRRQGLGISTSILTVLVILLYMKIRSIEKRQREKK
jgi:nitrate/TMAO reductase-like tetraheme cytochrome c subunit